jgi:hypothetical protein
LRGKKTRKENAHYERNDGTAAKPGTSGGEWKYSKTVIGQGITWAHLRRE